MISGSLGCGITQILHNSATIRSTNGDRDPRRMGLIRVRSGSWVDKLVLNDLLQQLFVIGAHVIRFCEVIDELLA